MTDDIVTRLRKHVRGDYEKTAEFLLGLAADEIEYLRRCLQHAIDHVGKWGLLTAEEKQAVLAEYEQAVRGE